MANELLDKAIVELERAVEAVRTASEYVPDAASAVAHGVSGGAIDPFVFRLAIFVLSIFVGYYVVWSVTPALHTPLMAVTNAISSVIVVGALLAVGISLSGVATGFGFVALVLAHPSISSAASSSPSACWRCTRKKRSEARAMSENFAAFLYLVSGVLFIHGTAARPVASHHEPARHTRSAYGRAWGIARIAIGTTLLLATPSLRRPRGSSYSALPSAAAPRRLYRPLHPDDLDARSSSPASTSLVGSLPPCWWPPQRSIRRSPSASARSAEIHGQALVENGAGCRNPARSPSTGSIIAFLKLDGRMSGKPIMLPYRHVINAALLAAPSSSSSSA